MEDALLDPKFQRRAEAVLGFFRPRLALPRILIDPSLAEDGLTTRGEIRLSSRVFAGVLESGVLAHELVHAWSREAVPPARWGALPREVPRFAQSLKGANVEEMLADRLAREVCRRVSAPFTSAYLMEDLPETHLLDSLFRARRAAESGDPAQAREALRRLSGLELAALALQPVALRWPTGSLGMGPLLRALEKTPLDAPRLLDTLARFLSERGYHDFRRSPLWEGDSPLEAPARARGGDWPGRTARFLHDVSLRLGR